MKPGRGTRAFTLLELLVAVTITLLLAAIMLSVTTGTLTIWRRTQEAFANGNAAKLALDLIERDLQSALHRKDGSNRTWLAAEVFNATSALSAHGWLTAGRMKPATADSQRLVPDQVSGLVPGISEARFGQSGVWLRFIATTAESGSEFALPRAVSYQIVRRPVSGVISAANPADVRYTLFRTFIDNQTTFVTGYDVAAGYGGLLANPSTSRDALASNVVDFGVWLYLRDSAGALRRIYPADNSDLAHAATGAHAPGEPSRYPEVADVLLRVLTDEGARLLDAMENSAGTITRPAAYASDAEWWWSVAEANSRVFVRRVEIKGGAP